MNEIVPFSSFLLVLLHAPEINFPNSFYPTYPCEMSTHEEIRGRNRIVEESEEKY